MVLWKFTFKEMKHRPGRAILTLLSIVIGVAAVVAVSISTATTHQAYQQIYQSVAGRAALEVVAAGGGIYADDVVPMLEKTPGVEAAAPSFLLVYQRLLPREDQDPSDAAGDRPAAG